MRYASRKLRNDREIVMEAVKQYEIALKYASDELKKDREFVKDAVKQCRLAAIMNTNKQASRFAISGGGVRIRQLITGTSLLPSMKSF